MNRNVKMRELAVCGRLSRDVKCNIVARLDV